jgi:hypothetical protein
MVSRRGPGGCQRGIPRDGSRQGYADGLDVRLAASLKRLLVEYEPMLSICSYIRPIRFAISTSRTKPYSQSRLELTTSARIGQTHQVTIWIVVQASELRSALSGKARPITDA